jgi:integrase
VTERTRGTGSVFQRVKRGVLGKNWYIAYYDRNGRQVQESTGQAIKAVAERRLRERLTDVEKGVPVEQSRKLRYEEIRDSLLLKYANNKVGLATRRPKIHGMAYLDEFFQNMLVAHINTPLLDKFVAQLQSGELQRIVHARTKSKDKRAIHGASNGTINRVLALLRRAMNLARIAGLIHVVPHFPMMKEGDARSGFIESQDFKKLLVLMPANLRPLILFLFTTGCRVGAATQITWCMVSKDGRSVSLPAHIVKNKKPITIPLTQELTDALLKQFRKTGSPVFDCTNLRREWLAATTAFGRPELLIHDLRRSGVRNLIDSGVQEKVAMTISGHKTRSVFDRYNISSDKQLMDAMDKLQQRSGNLMEASN